MTFVRFTDQPVFRNPWGEFERIRQGLDELFRSSIERGRGQKRANVYPLLRLYDEADKLLITAELPGVKTTDLDLFLEGETLTIQGKRDRRHHETEVSYHRREIESGHFSRAITLPVKVDAENIGAQLSNGVLTITLLKASALAPVQIKVTSE